MVEIKEGRGGRKGEEERGGERGERGGRDVAYVCVGEKLTQTALTAGNGIL